MLFDLHYNLVSVESYMLLCESDDELDSRNDQAIHEDNTDSILADLDRQLEQLARTRDIRSELQHLRNLTYLRMQIST